ncbi:MAG: flagellar biosynthetic protein FliO [Spirochaetota bacterium]
MKTTYFLFFLIIGLGFLPLSAGAEDVAKSPAKAIDEKTLVINDNPNSQSPVGAANQPLTTFTLWDFVRMVLILGAVIAVIYVVFHFLKKAGGPKLPENELFRIISSQAIGNSRSLHLVEVGKQIFLVGSGENAVTLVSEIADKETLDGIRLKLSNQRVLEKKNFIDILFNVFRQAKGGLGNPVHESVHFIKRQRERLRKL